MSRQRRNFSAKFKSDLVIELLKGEKDLNMIIPAPFGSSAIIRFCLFILSEI